MQPTARRTLLERHGRLMGRFRWVIIPLWIALLVGAVMLGGRLGDVTTSEATLPGTEGQKGLELIETHFSDGKDSSDIQPVFRNRDLTVNDAGYRSAVTASLDRAAALVPGTRVVSYFSTGSRDLVGQDGHMTFATLSIPVGEQVAADMMPRIRAALGTPDGFQPTLVGGEAAVEHDTGPIVNDDLARAEMIVLPVALFVLLLFFGSVVSALLPLLMAGATIMLAFAGTYLFGQGMEIADLVTNVITLVGVAIGVELRPADGLPLPRGDGEGRRPDRGDRPHDGDRRARRDALGRDRGDRARRARRAPRPVHPLDGDRRDARPGLRRADRPDPAARRALRAGPPR